ncbi:MULTISPECIES: hypothetical protein [Flavobacteriaceae]|jgi:hypothetical protein|uniref:Uncharacterized protein n=1 Tax=Arenibacter algicola TaxID=616991 RepID=A0A221V484_9FLAO|nr:MULTISPECIES: hypothetical protein [Flavobacteriaceae]ASO08395.1 hypothetical protein AREALGSMS7_05022 [Arenibacter algicola]USD26994.1 hypothetical protein MJO53_16885 [Allomuricauda aquimarina]|tara:strand:+ start:4155 stop:4451 length:297 start_codon:yes stop_codon:yes gene_type:complete
MDYKKDYRSIAFRVIFTVDGNHPDNLAFAAQPFEMLLGDKISNDPKNFLVYGRVGKGVRLEVGFRGFTFEMDQELHDRLGRLYTMIQNEYRKIIIKRL